MITVAQDTELREVRRKMIESNVGYLVVVDGSNKFVGGFSERDNLKCHEADPSTPISQLMRNKEQVTVVRENDLANEIPNQMLRNAINHVVVVDANDKAKA